MSRKEVLRVSHFSNSSCESLLIFCTTGSKVKAALSSFSRDAITLQPAIVALLLQLRSAKGALSLLRSTKLVSRQCYLRFGPLLAGNALAIIFKHPKKKDN